jgi:hypothetical protein
MKGTGYVNRDGARILAEDWAKNCLDPDYCNVRIYDNGVVRVLIRWVGKVENIDSSFADMWKVFRLDVWNYNDAGVLVPDPVEYGRWFPTRRHVEEAYENFLERWTASRRDEDGKFEEEDNDLKPPPPPNPDAPDSDVTTIKGVVDDGVGAW